MCGWKYPKPGMEAERPAGRSCSPRGAQGRGSRDEEGDVNRSLQLLTPFLPPPLLSAEISARLKIVLG